MKRKGDMTIDTVVGAIIAVVLIGGTAYIILLSGVIEPQQLLETTWNSFMATITSAIPLPISPPGAPTG